MPYLTASKLTKTIAGQQELVNLVDEKAEIDGSFDPLEENGQNVNRVMMCVDFALPLFNANVESTKFTKFYCDQILPNYYAIGTLKEGSTLQYHALKQLAELSTHCGKLENPSLHVVQIFDKLKHFMPLPPEDADLEKMPNLDLTSVECLLYAFHRLARQCPDFLTADPAVLKDFRARLTYFSIGVCGCKRSLEKHSGKKLNEDQQKIAPALFENISSLINDLYYTVPIYECKIQLSFKSLTKKIQLSPEKSSVPQKRHTPIHFESSNGSAPKNARPSKGEGIKLYAPPSGKFSNNFQSYGETTLHAIHSCVTQEARETHCSPASSQEGFETTGSSSYIAD
ncbi:unnamed protein product [Acanthoscelides obtectus]|nr:unnamed protein product [Acanthoscelides obtectus]CAK1633571.1 Apoptosis inhibitor 5 [Acanthoscelides obtectus]